MASVVARVPVRFRMNWGLLAGAIGIAGFGVHGAAVGERTEALFALGMVVAMFVFDRLLGLFGQMEDDERGSLRLGSLWLRRDDLSVTVLGVRWRSRSVTTAPLRLVPWLLHVKETDAARLASLGRGLDLLAAIPLQLAPSPERVLRDVSHWTVAGDGEMCTARCYGAVLLDDELVVLPDGVETWRRALGGDGPFPDASGRTLVDLLAWLPPGERDAVARAGAAVDHGQRRSRADVQRDMRLERRYARLPLDPGWPGGEDLSFKLDRREKAALEAWLNRA